MMEDFVNFHFEIDGDNFTSAGEASVRIKKSLREMGFTPDVIRRVSVAMYEGEINMVIHANGGTADVNVYVDKIEIILADNGPGISDIELAMQEGYSTAPDNIRSLGFGAGMGLPNMKNYTNDMRIESEVGKGTTIYMTVNV
jgi:anti-sigma regulatory factor (Ser/Thr protein kinase)